MPFMDSSVMKSFVEQKHLLRLLSLCGVIPFPSLLANSNSRGKYNFCYVFYVLAICTVSIAIGILEIFYPPQELMTAWGDKTSYFVFITGFCHWQVILLFIAIRSTLNIGKLAKFFKIIENVESRVGRHHSNRSIILNVAICSLIMLRLMFQIADDTESWSEVVVRLQAMVQGMIFDLYNLHVFFQVWALRQYLRYLNHQLSEASTACSHTKMIDVLQTCDLLFASLQAFNEYYGLFMAEMCLVAFLRCSLTLYFIMLLSDLVDLPFVIWLGLLCFAGWNSGIICCIFCICHSTKAEANETVLCTRHLKNYDIVNSRMMKQINKFLLKNLHQKKKFSAYGFFEIDNSVIFMVFSSIVTYLVILIQFKNMEMEMTDN